MRRHPLPTTSLDRRPGAVTGGGGLEHVVLPFPGDVAGQAL